MKMSSCARLELPFYLEHLKPLSFREQTGLADALVAHLHPIP
jgi:hypothetical protein